MKIYIWSEILWEWTLIYSLDNWIGSKFPYCSASGRVVMINEKDYWKLSYWDVQNSGLSLGLLQKTFYIFYSFCLFLCLSSLEHWLPFILALNYILPKVKSRSPIIAHLKYTPALLEKPWWRQLIFEREHWRHKLTFYSPWSSKLYPCKQFDYMQKSCIIELHCFILPLL